MGARDEWKSHHPSSALRAWRWVSALAAAAAAAAAAVTRDHQHYKVLNGPREVGEGSFPPLLLLSSSGVAIR